MRGGKGVCESHFLVIVSIKTSLMEIIKLFLGPFERSLVPLVLRVACCFACHQAELCPLVFYHFCSLWPLWCPCLPFLLLFLCSEFFNCYTFSVRQIISWQWPLRTFLFPELKHSLCTDVPSPSEKKSGEEIFFWGRGDVTTPGTAQTLFWKGGRSK